MDPRQAKDFPQRQKDAKQPEAKELQPQPQREAKQPSLQQSQQPKETAIGEKEKLHQDQAAAMSEKEKLLHLSEISLQLDTYEDIFSDFDPRSFSNRALSQDFLVEAQRASRESGKGTVSLKLLIPAGKRDEGSEAMIKKRLKEHFKKHSARIGKEIKDMVKKGIAFAVIGTIVMLAASLVLFFYATESIFSSFLVVFLEPAGWFFFWEGLYQVLFESKKMKPDFEFYKKMAKCEISFLPY